MFLYIYLLYCKLLLKPLLLHNKLNRAEAEKILANERFKRLVVSFYRYINLKNPVEFRNLLFKKWSNLKVLGRVYVANEGINAQVSVPEPQLNSFRDFIDSINQLKGIEFRFGNEENKVSFYKLSIKVKKQIVADGLKEKDFNYIRNELSNNEKLRYVKNSDVNLFTLKEFQNIKKINNKHTLANILLNSFEKLINDGQTDSDKATACQWILSGLTLVNEDARNTLPWLYQSAHY